MTTYPTVEINRDLDTGRLIAWVRLGYGVFVGGPLDGKEVDVEIAERSPHVYRVPVAKDPWVRPGWGDPFEPSYDVVEYPMEQWYARIKDVDMDTILLWRQPVMADAKALHEIHLQAFIGWFNVVRLARHEGLQHPRLGDG